MGSDGGRRALAAHQARPARRGELGRSHRCLSQEQRSKSGRKQHEPLCRVDRPGTTSSRFIVFDRKGEIIALAQKEHAQICPRPGFVEHDAEEIWTNTRTVIAEALAAGDCRRRTSPPSASPTSARRAWCGTGAAASPCTMRWSGWTRAPIASSRNTSATAAGSPARKDRLPLATHFSGLKLRWLLDSVEGAQGRCARRPPVRQHRCVARVEPDGRAGRRPACHGRHQRLAYATHEPRDARLGRRHPVAAAHSARLPAQIRSSSEIYGKCSGPLAGVALAGILGDQQAALFGQACLTPGQAKNTYGTGCFMLMNTGEKPFPSTCGLLTTLGYKLGDRPAVYALEGSIAIAGALVQWLRDNLGLVKSAPEIEALAKTVADNGDVYFVPAFSGLYAPHWKESAGNHRGLTRFANKGHIARAALEATAYQTREVLDAMVRDSGVAIRELRVDGGMVVNELLMQFQADILDAPVVRPKVIETTALGAAYAAGLAVGYWSSTEDISANWGVDRRWTPAMPAAERDRLMAAWTKAVARSLDWADR